MIYLDNAATTYPKPRAVREAVHEALCRFGANPGRGGHAMAMSTAEAVFRCREELAAFFGLCDPSGVCFTANCTGALNTVIKGLLHRGDHVVTSGYEHNSVRRPLAALGAEVTEAEVYPGEPQRTVDSFRRAVREDTRLIICTHASNVFGFSLPIREIGALAHGLGIPFAVDAAQSAGVLSLDMQRDHVDLLCLPGHKALYGPMGTGALLCGSAVLPSPLTEGGTGSRSLQAEQPEELPDRFESGTVNVPGICGLCAGVRFVREQGREALAERETALMRRLYEQLAEMKGLCLYTAYPDLQVTVPMVTLNVEGLPSEDTAAKLAAAGVAVRAGLHCAPSAHRRMGTLAEGAVRLCPSCFTTTAAVDTTAKILREITRKALQSRESMLK